MEQVLFYIALLILYWLYSSIVRRVTGKKKEQGRRPAPAAKSRQSPGRPAPGAGQNREVEVDIPPFLKKLLGLEDPEPRPPLPPPITALPTVETPPPRKPDRPERAEKPVEIQQSRIPRPGTVTTRKAKRKAFNLRSRLRNKRFVREAYILKEVIGKPVSIHRRIPHSRP